ncbi:MAG: pantoate--beta-alanine ligase [Gammaproteobacteria bacterium]
MQTIRSTNQLREQIAIWRSEKYRISFVPTMGNLHAGHLALVKQAQQISDRVVVSIFVNPMQFGEGEDYQNYPHTQNEDSQKLQAMGVDFLFMPDVSVIYPAGVENTTRVEVPDVSDGLCNDFRPGHFTGVATVVARLFNLVQPDFAVFGSKDYQQLAVIRKMVSELCFPIQIEAVETVREADGLAMSSRNQYLDRSQRETAPELYRALNQMADVLRGGGRDYAAIEKNTLHTLEKAGFSPDYVSIREKSTLALPKRDIQTGWVILAAARLGKARLIDNLEVSFS